MHSPINTIIKNNTTNTFIFRVVPAHPIVITANETITVNGDVFTLANSERGHEEILACMLDGFINISYDIENKFAVNSVAEKIFTTGDAMRNRLDNYCNKSDDVVKLAEVIEQPKKVVEEPIQLKEEPKAEPVKEVVKEEPVIEAKEVEEVKVAEEEPLAEAASTDTPKKRTAKKIKVD